MPISFAQIPANWKQPLYYVEVDASKAGLPVQNQPALLVGTVIDATAEATEDVPLPIGSQAQADKAFGIGSELALAFEAFFANNFAQTVWGLPLAEPTAGAAAAITITIATVPTEAGTIHLYVAGRHVSVNVAAADTVTVVATALKNAINADPRMPVTAANVAGALTLTCKWTGVTGNDIFVTDSYYGKVGGEELPVGLTITYPNPRKATGGTGTPTMTTAISNLGEQEFDYVSLPWTDTTTLLAWETEYGFSDSGRWGWMRQLFGHIFSAKRDSYANLVSFGNSRNSPNVSVMGYEANSPSPVWAWSAAYTAKAARGLLNDPARPLQTLRLESILPAPSHDRFNALELNSLALEGIATQRTLTDNIPMIARETTMYQENLYGQSDDAYELVTTLATLARLLRNQRQAITSKYPRHKLANDGTRFGPGQAVVTPKIIKAELVAQYRIDEFNGLVEDVANFKNHLIVERDPNDPNRVNVLYPPDLINGMRVFAVLAQFRLQFSRGLDQEIAA